MSEGTPIGRTDDPDAVETRVRSSADDDRAEGFAAEPLDETVDRDVDEAEEVVERLTSE